jgi:hypothetical protein
MQHQAPTSAPDDLLGLTVPVGLKRVGREMRMLVENANDQTAASPSEPRMSPTKFLARRQALVSVVFHVISF